MGTAFLAATQLHTREPPPPPPNLPSMQQQLPNPLHSPPLA